MSGAWIAFAAVMSVWNDRRQRAAVTLRRQRATEGLHTQVQGWTPAQGGYTVSAHGALSPAGGHFPQRGRRANRSNDVREADVAKRALILAGGGMKVGFQAGVLQVWLDEADLTFDHADGASGGCFNLAMYCQGMTGRQIADNWRNLDPFLPVNINTEALFRFLNAPSLFTLDRFRTGVLPFWGIDWPQIRAGSRLGTFNVFNFSKKRLDVVANDAVTEDHLLAAVSLPMWFPPVNIAGDTCMDAVFICDANVEEALRRGADEIWAIWTVSTRDEWRDGFVNQYFQIVETTADTQFFSIWERIAENNRRLAAGQVGEFGRHVTQRLIQAEVPVHYLFNFSKDRMAEAVNLGVKAAREWCAANGIPIRNPGSPVPAPVPRRATSIRFTEQMKGYAAAGESDPDAGYAAGKTQKTRLDVKLTVVVDDADDFVTNPSHQARIEGTVASPLVGGTRPVDRGTFNLFVHADDPRRKQMLYRLVCTDASGNVVTLSGVKRVENDEGGLDAVRDTTTLFVKVFEGDVAAQDEAGGSLRGAGIIHIEFLDFLHQMTTFVADGPSVATELNALSRFGGLFLGKLWDVYGPRG
jgi:predicted acylesterase/phospholipase RssA